MPRSRLRGKRVELYSRCTKNMDFVDKLIRETDEEEVISRFEENVIEPIPFAHFRHLRFGASGVVSLDGGAPCTIIHP
jgi:hypothetical protein